MTPSSREAAPVASVERLESLTRTLTARFTPRDFNSPENLDAAAIWIREHLEQAGARVSEQPFELDGITYRNIIGSFGPADGARVVIGAHYDAAGPYPGADDNASGVAGLIELAYMFAETPPSGRVDLVAFTLEEPPIFRTPYMGSRVHAQSLRSEGASVTGMLSLEMIGYFSDEPGSQQFPLGILRLLYPSTGNFITVAGSFSHTGLVRRVKRAMKSASPLPVRSINAPRAVPGIDFSDHASYWNAGYPAVMITDTAFYRNPNYHTARDTPDRLDYRRMAMVVDGVFAAARALTSE